MKKVMNKAIVRDLGHYDNAIDLACLGCLESSPLAMKCVPGCRRCLMRRSRQLEDNILPIQCSWLGLTVDAKATSRSHDEMTSGNFERCVEIVTFPRPWRTS